MTARVARSSRLRFSPLVRVDGTEFWDLTVYPEIPRRADEVAHTVKDGDELDALAFLYYADSSLDWVIAVANELEHLSGALETGTILRIPSKTYIQNTYLGKDRIP